jgi:DNA-binding PadR family transcriptional regulator
MMSDHDAGAKSARGRDHMTSERMRQILPLKQTWLHILLAVAGGHRHGYAIRQEVEGRTDGRVHLWPATLYGTLARLVDEGLLEETDENPDAEDDDSRRRYYRLTALGADVLEAETRRLEELVRLARSRRPLSQPRRA